SAEDRAPAGVQRDAVAFGAKSLSAVEHGGPALKAKFYADDAIGAQVVGYIEVRRRVKRDRCGGQPIPASAADFLVVAVDRFRDAGMQHGSHVGLIHAQAEGAV